MNQGQISISKSLVMQTLEDELKANQKKYNYHKKITEGYFELIQKTRQKLEDLNNTA